MPANIPHILNNILTFLSYFYREENETSTYTESKWHKAQILFIFCRKRRNIEIKKLSKLFQIIFKRVLPLKFIFWKLSRFSTWIMYFLFKELYVENYDRLNHGRSLTSISFTKLILAQWREVVLYRVMSTMKQKYDLLHFE
jgi:hypothetical protein